MSSNNEIEKFTGDEDLDHFSNLWIRFPKVWEDYADISWERQIFDGRRVLKYQLSASGENYKIDRYFGPSEQNFRLLGLAPNTTINVQVRVLTQAAAADSEPEWGGWAKSTVTSQNSTRVSVASVSCLHIHGRIQWGGDLAATGPTNTHVPVKADKYQLKVSQKGRVLSSDVCDKSIPAEGTVNDFRLDGMDANAVFEVRARAVSELGDVGKWCAPVRFLTLNPVVLRVQEAGETFAIVRWKRGEDDELSMSEGMIEELVVVVELLPSQRELDLDSMAKRVQVDAKTFANDTRMYRVRDLLPGRTYNIRSRYRNILGDWSDWSETRFDTLSAVRAVDVQLVGHNFIQVRWQRGEDDTETSFEKLTKDVESWEIRCATGNASTSMTLPAKENETKLVGLHSGIDYTIDVRALTSSNEWGPWSPPVAVTTLHLLAARVDFAGETWLAVSWDRKGKRYEDNITRYHVQLSCANTPFRLSKYFPATQTSFRFDSLKPANKYYIVVQAFSDQRWGPWSEPMDVTTCSPCVAQLIRRGEDFLHVRWNSDYYARNAVEVLDQRYQIKVTRPPIDDCTGQHSQSPTELLEEEVTSSTFRVQRLPPFSRVLVQVRAFDYTLQTWCKWGPTRELRTLPAVIVLTRVGETFAALSWSRCPRILSSITEEDMQNNVEDPLEPEMAKQFVLRLNNAENDSHKELAKYHFDTKQPTHFTVSELQPDTEYSLQLSYCDINGAWSSNSAPIRFRTYPPLRISVLDVGEGVVSIQWGRWGQEGSVESQQALTEESEFKVIVQDVAREDSVPMQFSVVGETWYAVNNLRPNTVYRIQVASAPHGGNNWGVWSEPAFVRTTAALECELELVGEDYAQVSWRRLETLNLVSILGDVPTATVNYQQPPTSILESSKRPAPPTFQTPKGGGNAVFVGDDTVLQYHVTMYKLTDMNEDELALHPEENPRMLCFELKLTSQTDNVRVPNLMPNTLYEVLVSASVRSNEWGCWSNALTFRTSMPTEIRVTSITKEQIVVHWGKGDAEGDGSNVDKDVEKYQLRVEGLDDEFFQDVELGQGTRSFGIRGLHINSCYSVAVRSFLKMDTEWGQWCHKTYLVLRVVPVELAEASQDWVHVTWPNKVAPDNRPKAQFLTLLGEGTATTKTLGPADKSHIFSDLASNSLYTVHLLSVEQSPVAVRYEGVALQKDKAVARTVSNSSASSTFSIPLVAADFSTYLTDGSVIRTHRALKLDVERVGQNFIQLKWAPHTLEGEQAGEDEMSQFVNEYFEVEVTPTDGDQGSEPRLQRCQGTRAAIRHLRPDASYRCVVRWVAKHSDVLCQWSNPVLAKLLPMIDPVIGDGTDTPGIGEDYLSIHWTQCLRTSNFEGLSGVSYEVRIVPLEGPNEGNDTVSDTKVPKFQFANLQPDTKFQISVRTMIAAGNTHDAEIVRGEWSTPLVCTTLSPMAVAITEVVEVGAVVHWRRKNCATGDEWWSGVENSVLRQEIATISSFHVRVVSAENQTVVYDDQFAEQHREYNTCSAKLKALKPGGAYTVLVRASTGMLWGAWSQAVTFMTQLPVRLSVPLVGEEFVSAQWSREADDGSAVESGDSAIVRIGVVREWELSFSTVGVDRTQTSVRVEQDRVKHCIGGLRSNCPYTVCVRPCYNNEENGPWSLPMYFVTLAPFKVDVGKVGETFVHVSWEREPQQTISMKMRYKQMDSAKHLDEQLEVLRERLQLLELGGPSSAPPTPASKPDEQAIGLDEMLAGEDVPSTETAPPEAKSSQEEEPTTLNELTSQQKSDEVAKIMAQIETLQEKQRQSKRLSQLQVAELERNAIYPKGEDHKYEVVVSGGGSDPFRRRLGKGENMCRLEGLTPKTSYQVVVRSLFSNGATSGFSMTNVGDIDEESAVPWGSWSAKVPFVTLKPISIVAKSIGSECIVVEWDTGVTSQGSSTHTAISRFQIHVQEPVKKGSTATPMQRPDQYVEEATAKGDVVSGLTPNMPFSVKVRVCYEGDKWGVWSAPIQFVTMPKLLCKLQSVSERQAEFVVWRDHQSPADGQNTVVWAPTVTEHQLAINGTQCAAAFAIEQKTSTLLTLDTLAVDTEYTISVRDRVEEHWQEFRPILQCETLPHAPYKPTLLERKGTNVAIAWSHRRNLENKQYVYMVEMALTKDVEALHNTNASRNSSRGSLKGAKRHQSEPGPFFTLGYTVATEYRMELLHPVHNCFFRVKVCKTNQTIDGDAAPIRVDADKPQNITIDSPDMYLWSTTSPVAHFKTPSVPDHPTGLHVTNLTHNYAMLKWKKPSNCMEHTGLVYRVYLNNSYAEKFSCIAETTDTQLALTDLLPNCHYRVAVAAESTMGSSVNNNTLHFSTRVMPTTKEEAKGMRNAPLTSTLPPRASLRAPEAAMKNRKELKVSPDDFSVLLDDRATTVFSGIKVSSKRLSPPRDRSESPDSRQNIPLDATATSQAPDRPSSASRFSQLPEAAMSTASVSMRD